MVKFIGDGDISSINLDSFMNQLSSDYSRYLETTPLLSLYFSKNIKKSTVDGNLDSVVSIVGPEGAYRYNAISNIPIYFDDNMSLSLETTEFGTEVSDTTINAIIIPNTITPQVDDYFEVKMVDNIRQLLRIIDVTPSDVGDRSFFRITVVVADESIEAIKEQTVSESELVQDNNGDFALCDKRKVQILKILNQKLQPILRQVIKNYYIGAINTIGVYVNNIDEHERYIIDLFMNRFIEVDIPYFKEYFSVMEFGNHFDDSKLDSMPHIMAKIFNFNSISTNISTKAIAKPFDILDISSPFHTMNGYNFHDMQFLPSDITFTSSEIFDVMPFLNLETDTTIVNIFEKLIWTYTHNINEVNKFIENELINKPIRLNYNLNTLYTIVAALKILNNYYESIVENSFSLSHLEQIDRLPILG